MDIERDYAYGIIPFYRESPEEYLFFIGRTQGKDGRKVFWKFPKGHKNHDTEEEVDAALRELREETAIDLPPAAVIQDTTFTEEYFYERGDIIVRKMNTFFLAQVATSGSGVPEVELDDVEFSEYRWATFEEAYALVPDNTKDMLSEAHHFLVRHRV